MNKLYRLVWNAARKQWIAACEFARGRTKSGRVGAPRARKGAVRVPLFALLAALGLASATAGAATVTWTNGVGDDDGANTGNWDSLALPTSGDAVIMDDPAYDPFVPLPITFSSGGLTANTLTLGKADFSGVNLWMEAGRDLTVVGGTNVGFGLGSSAQLDVNSNWSNSGIVSVGVSGVGIVNISSGATVDSNNSGLSIGTTTDGDGTVNVDGSWSSISSLLVADAGQGTLNIGSGGSVSAAFAVVGVNPGSNGYVSVDGAGSSLTLVGTLVAGYNGAGSVVAANGGAIVADSLEIGASSGGGGSVSVLSGSSLTVANATYIGENSSTGGSLNIDGVGSTANLANVYVGRDVTGSMSITNGASVQGSASIILGDNGSGSGTLLVSGVGSSLDRSSMTVGYYGHGEVTISDGAVLSATFINVAGQSSSSGVINIGAAEGDSAVAAGTLVTSYFAFVDGSGGLVFNHTETDYDFGADVQGLGTIKLLAGTTALSGDLTAFSGTLNVDGGTLSIADATTLHTGSSYAQTATGVLRVGASDVASFGKLFVDGAAVFDDGTTIDVDVAGVNTLADGDLLSGVVTATGGVTAGTFSVTDNSAMFDFTAVVNANTIDLQEIQTQTLQQSVLAATNQNPTPAPGAAGSLDQMIASPNAGFGSDASTLQTAFGMLSTNNQIARAVTNTLPVTSVSVPRASLASSSQTTAILAGRISAAIPDFHWSGGGLLSTPTTDVRTPASFGVNGGDEASVDRHVWLKPLVSVAHQGARDGYDGNDQRTFGLVGGADTLTDDNRLLGVAFGYTHSKISGNGSGAGQEIQIDGVSATLYGAAPVAGLADTTFDWQAGANANWLDSSRYLMISGDTAKADYRSLGAVLSAGLTKAYKLDSKTVASAKVRATYQHLHTQGYSESGAGALNLTVGSNDANALVLGVGGEVVHAVNDRMSLIGDATLRYDLLNERTSVQTAYAGGGSAFAVEGMRTPALSAQAGAGLQYVADNGLEITAKYDLQGTQDYLSHTGSVNLRWAF